MFEKFVIQLPTFEAELISLNQDREAEPRFTAQPTGGRGGYEGPPGRGGFGGGFGGGMGAGGGGRQIYVSNVCSIFPPFFSSAPREHHVDFISSFPTR